MIKEKNHWGTITDANLKNVVSIIPDKDFMNTVRLKGYQKIQILDIANNNRVTNYFIKEKKSSSNMCQFGCNPFYYKKKLGDNYCLLLVDKRRIQILPA